MKALQAFQPVDSSAVKRAFRLFQQGMSLRQIAPSFGTTRNTLSLHLKRYYGPDYAKYKGTKGLIQVLQEDYLASNNLSTRDRAAIASWLTAQMNDIIQSDLHSDIKLLTNRQERQLTQRETRKNGDYRDLFDAVAA